MAETEESFLGSENMNMTAEVKFLMQYPEPAASSVMRSHFILLRPRRTSNHQYDSMNFEIVTLYHFCFVSRVPYSNLGQETGSLASSGKDTN